MIDNLTWSTLSSHHKKGILHRMENVSPMLQHQQYLCVLRTYHFVKDCVSQHLSQADLSERLIQLLGELVNSR